MLRLRTPLALAALALAGGTQITVPSPVWAQAAPAAASPVRQSGTVQSITGTTLVVTTKAGPVSVPVAPDAVVVQVAADAKDLKAAVAVKLSDISVGDRVLTGKPGDTTVASRVVLLKSGDVAARNQEQQADWQKRGFSGLIKSVDGNVLTVTAGAKTVKVETTPATVFRRYAPDSIKYQDAKLDPAAGALTDIHAGDQLSARGDKSADGSEIKAEEVVTGSFANLSGLLTAVDASAGTITLKDLTTKKPVTVQVTANADLRQLPPQAAAMFAQRASAPGATPGAGSGAAPASAPASAQGGSPGARTPGAGGARTGMDLSRMLARLPTQTVADLKPGTAVMIVASPSSSPNTFTAITMLSGVDALLTAAPGAQPITLSPWTLGVPEAGGGAPQ